MATMATLVRRRRSALERTVMTPEEELKLLIKEQELDDTPFIRREEHLLNFEAPWGAGSTVGELIGVNEDGELVTFFRNSADNKVAGSSFSGEKTQHGTIYGYKRLLCRCLSCTVANKKHTADYRARSRIKKAKNV